MRSANITRSLTTTLVLCCAPALTRGQATQTFLVHGTLRSCSAITQMDSALADNSQQFFSGWNEKDYADATAWAQSCADYGWHVAGRPRLPLLQAQHDMALGAGQKHVEGTGTSEPPATATSQPAASAGEAAAAEAAQPALSSTTQPAVSATQPAVSATQPISAAQPTVSSTQPAVSSATIAAAQGATVAAAQAAMPAAQAAMPATQAALAAQVTPNVAASQSIAPTPNIASTLSAGPRPAGGGAETAAAEPSAPIQAGGASAAPVPVVAPTVTPAVSVATPTAGASAAGAAQEPLLASAAPGIPLAASAAQTNVAAQAVPASAMTLGGPVAVGGHASDPAEESVVTGEYFKKHFHQESLWVANRAHLDIGEDRGPPTWPTAGTSAQLKNRLTADKIVLYCARKTNASESSGRQAADQTNQPLMWDWRWCEAEEAAAYSRLVSGNEFPSAGRGVVLGCAGSDSYIYTERCIQTLIESAKN